MDSNSPTNNMVRINESVTSPAASKGFGLGRTQGATKRKKYASRACHDCKRRKVRCTGEEVCSHCQNRSVQCRYSPPPRDPEQFAETGRSSAGDPADSRVDALCDRVGTLERIVTHLFEMVKQPDRTVNESPNPFQKLVLPSEAGRDEGADLFAVRNSPPDDLSLSSQVAAIDALVSRPGSPDLSKGIQNGGFQILVEFPDPPSLKCLLDVYFRDFDCYFPFLDRQEVGPRIYKLIRRLGYSSYNRTLLVTIEHLPTIALACSMLALAACLDSGEDACDGDTKPGWELYLQACRSMHHIVHTKTVDLDVVRAQSLIASYLMYCELLSAASRALFLATQLAATIRLNNQRAWPTADAREILQRQQLWWTIYYLDRQIARKSGTVYHIRDIEFDVNDFRHETQSQNNNAIAPLTAPSAFSSSDYMQALINLAKLWGNIWDSFFATGATTKGDWMEVEIMDTQILNSRRQLSSDFTWDTEKLSSYTLNGEPETHIRRRLQLYTRSDLLRALIRHNPVRQAPFDPETAHFCARLSRNIIDANDEFISRFLGLRAIGYFTTACIVECIYHLVPVLYYSDNYDEHKACVESLNRAHGILIKLSFKTNVAKRALKAVAYAIKRWDNSQTSAPVGDGQADEHQAEEISQNDIPMIPQVDALPKCDLQMGMDVFAVDLGEWVNGPMGTLFNSDLDFRTGFQL